MNERILMDIQAAFGLTVRTYMPVEGGYLNLKWRVSTDQGDFLLKQYSPQRFSRRKLTDIEQALRRQMLLHKCGVACPRVYEADGQIIRSPGENLSYMLMDFVSGHVETPETCTSAQMESLGEACAKMHAEFMRLPVQGVKGFPLREEDLLAQLYALARNVPSNAPEEYLETLDQIRPIIHSLPKNFLSCFPKSICHEDFSGDNMLFSADCLSAIVDFDRNQFSFRHHDIARSLLSLALMDGRLISERIHAFLSGYNQHLALSLSEIADALRLAWWIEAPWWIQPAFFIEASGKVRRFMQEIQFLTQNWNLLDELIL